MEAVENFDDSSKSILQEKGLLKNLLPHFESLFPIYSDRFFRSDTSSSDFLPTLQDKHFRASTI